MRHIGTRTIETPRLILRRFMPDDAHAMFCNWASDPEVTKYLTWPPHTDENLTRQLLTVWADAYAKPDYYQWAIVLKNIGEPIGSIAVVSLDSNPDAAEIGYCIGRKWWHQGITSEALYAVMDELFYHVGIHSITARHDPRNPNSGAVMRKCGMTYSHNVHGDHNNQGECDAVVHAIDYRTFAALRQK